MSFENAFKDSSDSQLEFDTDEEVDETSNNLQNLLNDETSTLILDTNNSQDSQGSQNSRKTSSLWTHVDCQTPTHLGVPVCKRCNFMFSNKSGNSSIERHLKRHNIIVPKVKKQSILNFKCTNPWPEKEKLERDQIVVIWVISDQQPFRVVENKNFIKMINTFDPRYTIPNRHQIKAMVIQEFNKRCSNIGYDLRKIPEKVAFTADMWTSTLSSEAYLGLTIHYIDQNWVLQRFLLNIIPFKIRHSGINIASSISNILGEFNLISKAIALTTDNESAML
ncbi:670_t:CDS:1, partial [Funneliformis geosporum]